MEHYLVCQQSVDVEVATRQYKADILDDFAPRHADSIIKT